MFWVLFSVLGPVSGYTIFETLSPTGILSRALIYGPAGAGLGAPAAAVRGGLFAPRLVPLRLPDRAHLWYGGHLSPVRVMYRLEHCFHEGDCKKVCLFRMCWTWWSGQGGTYACAGRSRLHPLRPGVDVCPSGALQFDVKGLSKMSERTGCPVPGVYLTRSTMIRFQGVVYRRKLFKRHRVLDGIDLGIELGERIALIGSNGAGKTTLIRCLLGEYTHAGEISIDGGSRAANAPLSSARSASFPNCRRRLRCPSASWSISRPLCGTDSQRMHRDRRTPRPRHGRDPVTPVQSSSGGMKQKLLIAIALGRDAKVLVMDEPAANLDPEARHIFFQLLAERLHDTTMLISSHRLDEVAPLVNRVIEMDMGRIVLDDRVADDTGLACCRRPSGADACRCRHRQGPGRLVVCRSRRRPALARPGARPRSPALPRHDLALRRPRRAN